MKTIAIAGFSTWVITTLCLTPVTALGQEEAGVLEEIIVTATRRELITLADNADPSKAVFERSTDARYVGQGYELRLPLPDGQLGQTEIEKAISRFHDMHQQEYGHHFPDSPVEWVNLRITAINEVVKIGVPEEPKGGSLAEARLRTDETMFRVVACG